MTETLKPAIAAIRNYDFKNSSSFSEISELAGFVERAAAELDGRLDKVMERERAVHEREVAVQLREDNAAAKLQAVVATERAVRKIGASRETWVGKLVRRG